MNEPAPEDSKALMKRVLELGRANAAETPEERLERTLHMIDRDVPEAEREAMRAAAHLIYAQELNGLL